MKTIVVGGHSRNVGKTSVAAAIIASRPQYSWTAVKISPHRHEEETASGKGAGDAICRIDEEYNPAAASDTGRFLAAGASRSFWVRIREGRLEEALPQLTPLFHSNPYVIIESNGIVRYIQPDLYLMVLRYDVEDYKDSARETLRLAHAVVAVNYNKTVPAWKGISPETISRIPIFPVTDPQTLPQDLKDFIKLRLD
jgi:hypothetical protein